MVAYVIDALRVLWGDRTTKTASALDAFFALLIWAIVITAIVLIFLK